MVFKISDIVPSARYSTVCNVLRLYGASGSSLLIESSNGKILLHI